MFNLPPEKAWACDIAPCLTSSPYADEARRLVDAGLSLPADAYGVTIRAVAAFNLSFMFRTIEQDSQIPPIPAFKATLLANMSMMTAARLAMPSIRYPVPDERPVEVEMVTADHYSALFSAFDNFHFFEEPTQLLKQRLERNHYDMSRFPEQKGLDAGCGSGRYTVALRKLGMREAHGLDLSDKNIREAESRCQALNIDGVTFRQGDVLSLPYPDATFDFVFSNGVLHHTVDCAKGVRELVRVLKPGGIGFFKVMSDPGGIHWDFIELCRVLFHGVPHAFVHRAFAQLNVPANLRYLYLDHMLVPINVRFTDAQCQRMLEAAGAVAIRRLERGADIDRDERIFQGEPNSFERFGIGVNRYYFEKPLR